MLQISDDKNNEPSAAPVVLIVDDELTARLLAGECLKGHGFEVHEAEDGIQAVEKFRHIHPNIVLMDVMMPGMDGFEACRSIRQMQRGERTPILMMTGLNDVESIQKAYEVGATDFIAKPLRHLILVHRVRYLLRSARLTAALQESEGRLAKAQQIAKLGNWEWNLDTDNVHVSEQVGRMLQIKAGTHASSVVASQFLERVHPKDRTVVEERLEALVKHAFPLDLIHRVSLPDGTSRTLNMQAAVATDDEGRSSLVTGTAQDVTEREEAQDKIRYLAYHDSLTGLPNRESFRDYMQRTLELARRGERTAAILFLDLDNFKAINDTLSHRVGDLLLEQVANSIVNELRLCDRVMQGSLQAGSSKVARLGGDEFTILLAEIQNVESAAVVARRILSTIAKPMQIAGNEVFITASLGVAVYPHDGQDVDFLLMNADTAMYSAKADGKNTYRFYDQSMNARARERLAMENKLRKAVEREELSLHYQPQVNLRTARIAGLEALLRWKHPEQGNVSPMDFIPLAEESGLIVELGEWVMEKACVRNRAWQEAGLQPIPVAVNVSSVQFRHPDFVNGVREILKRSRLEPRWLELEVTESVVLEAGKESLDKFEALKAMGIRLAIDDFGTGYSSLSYLRKFPFDSLKIDRAFIRDTKIGGSDSAIAMGIIFIGHGLGLEVVAEGVESSQQLEVLRMNNCDRAQGYYFGRPQPPEDVAELLVDLRPRPPEIPVEAQMPNEPPRPPVS